MTQLIDVNDIAMINGDLLDTQLKSAAPDDCYGFTFGREGLRIVVSDTITPSLIATLKNICVTHDPSQLTPRQAAEQAGKADTANLFTAVEKALADIATKKAAFTATPNLANAGPLLLEITDDLTAVIKVVKHLAKRAN